jgi:Ni,Fe-hydrogenase I cytochrome b subunit
MNITKEKVETEIRFFLFMEKEPYHSVVQDTRVLIAMLAAFVPTVMMLGLYGFVVLSAFKWYGLLEYATLILVVELEGFHYKCDRHPRKVEIRYDGRHMQSGREAAEEKWLS